MAYNNGNVILCMNSKTNREEINVENNKALINNFQSIMMETWLKMENSILQNYTQSLTQKSSLSSWILIDGNELAIFNILFSIGRLF